MGNIVTRRGLHRHSYDAMPAPAWVVAHAVTASVNDGRGGVTTYPVTAGVATFAADGAPYYNTGYLPGYGAQQMPGGQIALQLPPRAAMLDLTDRQSWDRPVFWPGSF